MHTEENKYIIAKTVEEQKEILQILEKEGYQWTSGTQATNYVPIRDGHNKYHVIYIRENYDDKTKQLQTSTTEFLRTRVFEVNTEFIEITIQEFRHQFRPIRLLL